MTGSSKKTKMSSTNPKGQPSRKYQKKGVNSVRSSQVELSVENVHPNSLICQNSACRAIMSINDRFCKRCSCHICMKFDDNKDPSLWLVCTDEDGDKDSCGLSSHLECVLQSKNADRESSMIVDGSYWCACGKVSSIIVIGCWKRQLTIAKEARHVKVLRERISLSQRLLNGTLEFEELLEIIQVAMGKLENEFGPIRAKMPRKGGIVATNPVAVEVQTLCALAIQRADGCLSALSINLHYRACRFSFEEITASSIVIVLIEPLAAPDLDGFKLWYCKSGDETYSEEPINIFPKTQTRILIADLQATTEYSFRLVSYTEAGDVGLFEARCSTESKLLINEAPNSDSKAPIPDLNVALVVPDQNEEPRSDGTGVSKNGKLPAGSPQGLPEKRVVISNDKKNENTSISLDVKLECCVKLICRLERDGHISEEFRRKFLTWFSLRSTGEEKRVVYAFIEAFTDSPSSLAVQLVDTFRASVA